MSSSSTRTMCPSSFSLMVTSGGGGEPYRALGLGLRIVGKPKPKPIQIELGWKGSKQLSVSSSVVGFQPLNHKKRKNVTCFPTTIQSKWLLTRCPCPNCSSRLVLEYGHGSKSRTPSEHPIQSNHENKCPKMGGEFTNPNQKWDPL